MVSTWDDLESKWTNIEKNISIFKFNYPTKGSLRYDQPVMPVLETAQVRNAPSYYGLKKFLMPLPSTVLAFPSFRYIPFQFSKLNSLI